ncbi:MAG: hypothetical protein JNG85_01540 [Spirochaetaceae bacterium]|nr:hypothetical protein [Spirochaetaceae bacterium]
MATRRTKADKVFMDNLTDAVEREFAQARRRTDPARALPPPAETPVKAARPKAAAAEPVRARAAPAKAAAAKALPAPAKKAKATANKPAAKPAAAKSAAAKPAAKSAAKSPTKARAAKARRGAEAAAAEEKAALLKELRGLLPGLDAEGLEFLIEQARVHLHNMEVERLEKAREERRDRAAARDAGAGPTERAVLAIERSASGSSYYVSDREGSSMLNSAEMLALVRIVHGRANDSEAGRALGAWLEKERRDVLNELFAPSPTGPTLTSFAALIRKTFRKPEAR